MPAVNKISEKIIDGVIQKWRPYLGIDGRWSIGMRIFEPGEEWPHGDSTAAVRVLPGYYQISLHLNRLACEQDDDTIEHIVLHELVHFVLWPLSVMARNGLDESHEETWRDVMEAAVEQVTRALLRKKEIK